MTGVPKKFIRDTAQARVLRALQLAKAADEVILTENATTIFNHKVESHRTALRDEGARLIQNKIITERQMTELFM